jgi:hypothetical protein
VRLARPLAAAALLVATATPVAAQQQPGEGAVRIDVRAMSASLTPGVAENLVVRARAVNTTTEPVRRLRVSLRFGAALRGRSAIAAPPDADRLGFRVGDRELSAGELAAGGTDDANFDVPLARLPFGRNRDNAIFPMRIEVRSFGRVVGTADTYVLWWPRTQPKLRVAWLWPLTEPSHRALGDDFYDDGLAASVGGGRLDTLLRIGAASGTPLTWAVDPELVDSLHRMSSAYTVRGDARPPSAPARAWLDRARAAVHGAQVLPLPYADPDLASTATGTLAADASRAFQAGRDLLTRDLGTAGDPSLAWPPGTTLDPAVQSLLAGQGVKGVVVPSTALPVTDQLPFTPSAPAPLTAGAFGSLTALVADAQLNGWVAATTGAEGPRLAAQRFLADTAMTVMERPSDTRDVVLAPPRAWEPARDFARDLLVETAAAPWLTPVTVGTVLGEVPSPAARTVAPPAAGLLPVEQLRRVADLRRRLQRVRGIFGDPKRAPAELADLDDALLRAVSARWGEDPSGGQRLADTVDAGVARQLDKLRVVTGGVVTMTGRSGRIPLTFSNDLGQTVRVRVRVDSKKRLRLEGNHTYEAKTGEEVAIPPGGSTLVIRGKATTGGLFNIKVDLLANDGAPLGIRTTLRVRSTAYGVVALVVTSVAFGLLLVASATRLLKRRRGGGPPAPVAAPEPVTA